MKVGFPLVSFFQIVLLASSSSISHVAGNQGGSSLRKIVSNSSTPACEPNPCQNNGHCQEVAVNEGVGAAAETHCMCSFGYYGPFCTETDDQLTLKYARPSSSGGNGRKLDKILNSDHPHSRQEVTHHEGDDSRGLQGDMALPIKSSVWNCYTHDPILHKGTVDIWWGHAEGDGAWACNSWISECGGSCHATSVYYIDNNDSRWTTSDNTCSGTGGTCNAVSTPDYTLTIGSFKNDDTWDQVMGCGGAFALTAASVTSDNIVVDFGTTQTYMEWEGCCAVVGETLQQRGLLSDGWRCRKNADLAAVRIDLLGKNACWGGGTLCLAGTTCNYCCDGSAWSWGGFGYYCN